MREKVFTFGPGKGIVGVLTEPDASVLRPDAPVAISSNVGMHSHSGPHRLYVDLARSLASRGYPMLRFDLSGQGDSAPRTERVNEFERAVLDVRDAMDALTERAGAERFVPLGLCSGVDSTHSIARDDRRVAGAIFIEGYTYRTREFQLRHYGKRFLSRRFWEMYGKRKLAEYTERLAGQQGTDGPAQVIYSRNYPSLEQLERDYTAMLTREAALLFVFAGGMHSMYGYNYEGQFADLLPSIARDRRVDVTFFPKADHVYTALVDRRLLVDRIVAWFGARFP